MNNRRNNKRPAQRKERLSIIAASVFVLSALTLTGVYIAASSKNTEDNKIDFAKLEQGNDSDTAENQADARYVTDGAGADLAGTGTSEELADSRFGTADDTQDAEIDMYDLSDNNDLDVEPGYTEVNSGSVESVLSDATQLEGTDKAAVYMSEETSEEPLTFAGELALPVVGEVLIDYSMDKAVYFETMQQYKYSPALVLAADEGATVTAAADALVTSVCYDTQTGNTVTFDLGDGYELTYGQLTDIEVNVGDRVSAGDLVGKVAAPTIYYSEEGSNIYFKLTKDGTPIDPLSIGQED